MWRSIISILDCLHPIIFNGIPSVFYVLAAFVLQIDILCIAAVQVATVVAGAHIAVAELQMLAPQNTALKAQISMQLARIEINGHGILSLLSPVFPVNCPYILYFITEFQYKVKKSQMRNFVTF
ncbi:MAG: hypothetical protein KH319_07735 [Butyricicoccus pullicaecorum]|nr:hypothetical protein [Butyricicoccus pullicaecorum]